MRPYIFCFALTFLILNCTAQSTNAYKFIEPNISITYDSTQVKITNNFYNPVKNTEAADFTFYKDLGAKSVIHVSAQHPLSEVPSVRFIDSFMLAELKDIPGTYARDPVIRHINTFSCAGFIMYDGKNYATNITCNRLTNNDMTEVTYKSFADKDLQTGYKKLASFLAGFKSYSHTDLQKEEEQIKKTYKITVEKAKQFQDEFTGIVKITPKPTHQVYGVFISSVGRQLFQPDKDNNIYISCRYDYSSNTIKGSGQLVVLTSFGKKVEVPFTFESSR